MKVQKRRRREAKTDYKHRYNLLKSGKPRLVFRKTNKYVIAEYVVSEEAKDKAEICMDSRELLKYGWPKELEGSLKSIPASYLLGYLVAKKILTEKKDVPVVDVGMIQMLYKTKPYAFIKGLNDAGLKISCPEEAYPEQERIEGKNLIEDFTKWFAGIKSEIDKGIK